MATKKKAAPKKAVRKVVKKRAYNRKPKPEMTPVIELREIEIIDLRGLEDKDRFGILCMLDNEGYITSTVESLLKSNNLLVGLETDTLMLNHQNKLVRPATWKEASADSAYISRPSIRLNVQIGFSRPKPAYEDALQIGDAHYVRVA